MKAQLTQRQQEMLTQMQEYEAGQDDEPEGGAQGRLPAEGKAANPRYRGDDSDDD